MHTYVLPKVRGRSPSGHYLLHTWWSRTLVHRKICVVVGQTKRDRNIAREWVARSTSCGRPFNALFDVGMRVFNSAQVISRNTLRATPPRTIGTKWYSKHKHVEKTWQNRFEKAGRLPKFYFTSARLNCVPCAKQTVSSNNDNFIGKRQHFEIRNAGDFVERRDPFPVNAVARGRGMGVIPRMPEKIRMVGNEGPITDCLIHRVTKYSGFHDACVRFSFLFLAKRYFANKLIQTGLS